jgi:hypothetical protein
MEAQLAAASATPDAADYGLLAMSNATGRGFVNHGDAFALQQAWKAKTSRAAPPRAYGVGGTPMFTSSSSPELTGVLAGTTH